VACDVAKSKSKKQKQSEVDDELDSERDKKKITEGQEPKHKIRRGTKNQKTRRRKFKF